MVIINLDQEQKILEGEISDLKTQITPLQNELRDKQERLSHIIALKITKKDNVNNNPLKKLYRGIWADLCRQNNVKVGGDSAHRALLRHCPEIHASIPHSCSYDNTIHL